MENYKGNQLPLILSDIHDTFFGKFYKNSKSVHSCSQLNYAEQFLEKVGNLVIDKSMGIKDQLAPDI